MLSQEAKKELKEIILRDKGISLTDEQAEKIGASLLRLTRLGVTALARASEEYSLVDARDGKSLDPKTSA